MVGGGGGLFNIVPYRVIAYFGLWVGNDTEGGGSSFSVVLVDINMSVHYSFLSGENVLLTV